MDPRDAVDLLMQVFRAGEIHAMRNGLDLLSPDQPEDAAIVASALEKLNAIVEALDSAD